MSTMGDNMSEAIKRRVKQIEKTNSGETSDMGEKAKKILGYSGSKSEAKPK